MEYRGSFIMAGKTFMKITVLLMFNLLTLLNTIKQGILMHLRTAESKVNKYFVFIRLKPAG